MKKNENNNSCYGNVIANITRFGFSKVDFSFDIKCILDSRFIDSCNEMVKFTRNKWPTRKLLRSSSPERTISDPLLNLNALIHNRCNE